MQFLRLHKIEKLNVLNNQLVRFFLRFFVLLSAWFVCYNLLLKPARVIDKPLTNFLAKAVVKVINYVAPPTPSLAYTENAVDKCTYLTQNNKEIFAIFDYCNGVDLMFIYVGIIFLLPYTIKRKVAFSIGGLIAINIMNVIRITCLYLIYVYNRNAFDFSHHYLFTLVMYLLIFYGWLLYTKNQKHTNI